VLADPALQDKVRSDGAHLLAGLEALAADGLVSEARGRGLMCAVDLHAPRAAELVDGLLHEGYLANNTSSRTVRFLPPLVIARDDLDGLLAALRRVLGSM
jgi:acetylornithine/succinyldiaminopimelate/putrescine aminotransferase